MSLLSSARVAARGARRAPGYRRLRTQVRRALRTPLGRVLVRRAAVLAQLVPAAGRSSGEQPSSGRPSAGLGLAQGTVLPQAAQVRLPTVLVDLTEVPDEHVPGVVREVARCQVLGAGFTPAFLGRDAVLGAARTLGYVAETLPAPSAWGLSAQEWDDLRRDRVASMTRHYRARGLLEVGTGGLTPAQAAFLVSVPVPCGVASVRGT